MLSCCSLSSARFAQVLHFHCFVVVRTVADLSELSAQTDAFARAQRPVTGGRDAPRSNASSPTTALQANRLSSYSSVVSSATRTSSLDHMLATTLTTAKPSVTSSGVDVGQRASGSGLATGTSLHLCFTCSISHYLAICSVCEIWCLFQW